MCAVAGDSTQMSFVYWTPASWVEGGHEAFWCAVVDQEPAVARKVSCYQKYNWPLRDALTDAECLAEAICIASTFFVLALCMWAFPDIVYVLYVSVQGVSSYIGT